MYITIVYLKKLKYITICYVLYLYFLIVKSMKGNQKTLGYVIKICNLRSLYKKRQFASDNIINIVHSNNTRITDQTHIDFVKAYEKMNKDLDRSQNFALYKLKNAKEQRSKTNEVTIEPKKDTKNKDFLSIS